MVPKALYGSWYRASRLGFLQQWTCVASFSLNAHPGPRPQGHPAAGPGPGQETGCPYLCPQHMGMVRNNVRLPWPFIFIHALIQQTFHDNMCQGVWMNNIWSPWPDSEFTLHPKTQTEELDILKSLGKLHLSHGCFMFVSLGAVICAVLCPCEAQLLWDALNSASSISGLPRCIGNIYLVTTALFCFWCWIRKCSLSFGNVLVNEKQMVAWEVQSLLTGPEEFLGRKSGLCS